MPFFGRFTCGGGKNQLKEINELSYSHNNLTYVPEEIICHERSLEELYLDSNRINELPRVIKLYSIFLMQNGKNPRSLNFQVAFSMLRSANFMPHRQ